MRIKTSELKGVALDWAVAKCEGKDMKAWRTYKRLGLVNSSTDWEQGGPIIERETICVACPQGGKYWDARLHGFPPQYVRGPTALIAAMRCYVASKLGDEVEVPDELVKE